MMGRLRTSAMLMPLIVWLVLATACGSWVRRDGPTVQAVRKGSPARLRIARQDGVVLVIEHPLLVGDSVIGWLPGTEPPRRVSVPLGQVEVVERWRNETAAGIAVAVGIVILLFLSTFPFMAA